MTTKALPFGLIALAATVFATGCGDSSPSGGAASAQQNPGASEADATEAASPTAADADAGCDPDGDLRYVCGPVNAEDIVQIEDSDWLIVSGMSVDSEDGYVPGRLYLVDHVRKTYEEWFPGVTPEFRHDADRFAECPSPLNVDNFSAHGLALAERGQGRFDLYITSHGEREAIEMFEVDASGGKPSIAWVGCVVLPERTFANSVAILSEGGFVTTKMMDPTDPAGFGAILAGGITGQLYEWHGGPVEAVPETELSGANGIVVSPDERYVFVAAIGSREIVRYEADWSTTRESVTIDVRPDNLRWSDAGTLYTIGGNYVPPDECANPPCATGWSVIEIDPETLEATRVAGADQNAALQGASTALPVGDEIWIGTFSGDRIGYLPRNTSGQ